MNRQFVPIINCFLKYSIFIKILNLKKEGGGGGGGSGTGAEAGAGNRG